MSKTGAVARFADGAGVLGASFAALCCAGTPFLVGALTDVGLGFPMNDAILWPLMFTSLAVALWGIWIERQVHGSTGPLGLAAFGAAALLAGVVFIHGFPAKPVIWAGAAALMVATLGNLARRRRCAVAAPTPVSARCASGRAREARKGARAVLSVAGRLTVGVGALHLIVGATQPAERSVDVLWFAGSGLAVVLIGVLTLPLRAAPEHAGVRAAAVGANVAGVALAVRFGVLARWRAPPGPDLVARFVADGIGRGQWWVADTEGGERRLYVVELLALAKILGRPAEWFVRHPDPGEEVWMRGVRTQLGRR